MKPTLLFLPLLLGFLSDIAGQAADPLNTAANASYMKESEKAMIREINLFRSDPEGYLVYVEQYVEAEKKMPEKVSATQMKYSLTFNYELVDGEEKLLSVDTTWLGEPENEEDAVESLRRELKAARPLSILLPDSGIYEAVKEYARDQDLHGWTLIHNDSQGRWPWDRIRQHSPGMADGNENIASRYPQPTPRQIVIQLLIDTGIPNRGHRANLLDPRWTHVACYDGGYHNGMFRWLQNFGVEK